MGEKNYPNQTIEQATSDYDLRGAWREIQKGTMQFDERKHLPDKYKKPTHITFSNESIYADKNNPGGRWYSKTAEGKSLKENKEIWHFEPSPQSLKLHGAQKLQNYFKENEPDARLILGSLSPQESVLYNNKK